MICLKQDGDDQAFLSRMLQEAGEGKKPVLMCPYTVAKVRANIKHHMRPFWPRC